MAKAFLFHNPRCSKSRQALNLLEKEKENFEVFMYLDEKLEKDFLKEIIQKLGMSPRDLLRTGESAYKENNLKDSNISDEDEEGEGLRITIRPGPDTGSALR